MTTAAEHFAAAERAVTYFEQFVQDLIAEDGGLSFADHARRARLHLDLADLAHRRETLAPVSIPIDEEAAAPAFEELGNDADEPDPDAVYVIDTLRAVMQVEGVVIDQSRRDNPIDLSALAGVLYSTLATIGALR